MLKSVQRLVKEAGYGVTKARYGNHSFFADNNKNHWYFKYHDTVVCVVDQNNHTVSYSTGGYDTSSTNRAVNSYLQAFKDYREVPMSELDGGH